MERSEYTNKLPAVAKWDADGASIAELTDLFSAKSVSATINGKDFTFDCIETLMPRVAAHLFSQKKAMLDMSGTGKKQKYSFSRMTSNASSIFLNVPGVRKEMV